jgi:hypothetical protein
MKTIYLIRHGEIDKLSLFLDENGIKFSEKIVEYFRGIELNYLTSSNVIRCIETILPLSKYKKLNINTFDDYLFKSLIPLSYCKSHENSKSLICYKWEFLNYILIALKQKPIDDDKESKDKLYNSIIQIQIDDKNEIKLDFIKLN